MILCSRRNNNQNIVKIYEIKSDVIMNYKLLEEEKLQQKEDGRQTDMTYHSKIFKSDKNLLYREIFSCILGFYPIY